MSWFGAATAVVALATSLMFFLLPDTLPRNLVISSFYTAYGTLIVLGILYPGLNFFLTSVCRVRAAGRRVALTFDDGPDARVSPGLLDLLAELRVPAAFFYVGRSMDAQRDLVRRADAAGHLLANHTHGHALTWAFMPGRALAADLGNAARICRDVCGRTPRFFRPPFSVTRPGLGTLLRRLNLVSIGWDVRGAEGARGSTPELIAGRILAKVRGGSIILMHECYYGRREFSAAEVIRAVRLVITGLRAKGFELVRLDELLGEPGYEVANADSSRG